MADLIDRDAVLSEITRCKDYAHKTFARSSADKKQKNFYEHTAYCDGVFDAWEDAETLISRTPAVNRWIPCSERLPEVDTNVLIYYPKWQDAPVQTAHIMLDGTCWEFSDGEFYPSKSEITHWMPLPEPPEKE